MARGVQTNESQGGRPLASGGPYSVLVAAAVWITGCVTPMALFSNGMWIHGKRMFNEGYVYGSTLLFFRWVARPSAQHSNRPASVHPALL